MTSFPIIWFAVFDYEFERDRKPLNSNSYMVDNLFHQGDENLFMRNPNLYKPGMVNQYFGKLQMLKWILYAIWHAFVSYLICFFVISGDATSWSNGIMSDGKENGFWVAGHVVYASTVLVSNWALFHCFHIHHWGGISLISLMYFSLFFFMWLESSWVEPTLFADLYRLYGPTFG
jgi:hypothetical protein